MPRSTDGATERQAAFASSMMNGFKIIEAFTIDRPVLGVTQIAEKVGMHKSTVSRTLATLLEAGYVEREQESGRFKLGLGVIALAGPLLAHLDVRKVALPVLEDVSAETQETAALTLWRGDEAIVIEQVTSPRSVMQQAAIGTRYTRFESSSVRVFLAEGPEAVAQSFFWAKIEDTGLSYESYTAALEQIRRAGYAVNDGLTADDEVGLSAPIRDLRSRVAACVTLSAPRFRLTPDKHEKVAAQLVAAADLISRKLGHQM